MLLRSSSTPVLGSLLCSSESPSSFDGCKHHPSSDHLNKISFIHGGYPGFHPFSCNSSPISNSINRGSGTGPFNIRRANSDGNLEGLASEVEDLQITHPPRSSRRHCSVLQTIPSFSFRESSMGVAEEEDEEAEQEEEGQYDEVDGLEGFATKGENIKGVGEDLSFPHKKTSGVAGIDEVGETRFGNGVEVPPLFLARGLGIGFGDPSSTLLGGNGAGGSDVPSMVLNGGGGEGSHLEDFYKKMVEENPSNALFLRNYAQFLYSVKGDYERAEEYYARAILAEPSDGEVLLQYAKLIWDYHRDQERASRYFEQAIQAAPSDSHVLAAYASFLWDTEDEEGMNEEEDAGGSKNPMVLPFMNGAIASSA